MGCEYPVNRIFMRFFESGYLQNVLGLNFWDIFIPQRQELDVFWGSEVTFWALLLRFGDVDYFLKVFVWRFVEAYFPKTYDDDDMNELDVVLAGSVSIFPLRNIRTFC
ncbi:MAG TPA: hypothetical protein DCE42_23165 [Myxococcales bacterium]|nr:hypothetical protein [Myxococcales bacterium]